jgi:hypothetical protein
MWTDHCLQNGDSTFPPSLVTKASDIVVKKGTNRYVDAYSAFMDNTQTLKTSLDQTLQNLGVSHLYVAGIATDVCVKWTVRDALSNLTGAYNVTVIRDATEAVLGDKTNFNAAMSYMQSLGATIVNTSDVLATACLTSPTVAATTTAAAGGATTAAAGGAATTAAATGTTAATATTVFGAITLTVSNTTALLNNNTALTAFKNGMASQIASQAGVSASAVTIIVSSGGRRLAPERELTAGPISVTYTISTDTSTSSSISSTMAALTEENFKTFANTVLSSIDSSLSVTAATFTSIPAVATTSAATENAYASDAHVPVMSVFAWVVLALFGASCSRGN